VAISGEKNCGEMRGGKIYLVLESFYSFVENYAALRLACDTHHARIEHSASISYDMMCTVVMLSRARNFGATLRFESAGTLEIVCDLQDAPLAEMRTEDLHSNRETVRGFSAGN
jgi:hypothetical protein